jgi:hypothetical protein
MLEYATLTNKPQHTSALIHARFSLPLRNSHVVPSTLQDSIPYAQIGWHNHSLAAREAGWWRCSVTSAAYSLVPPLMSSLLQGTVFLCEPRCSSHGQHPPHAGSLPLSHPSLQGLLQPSGPLHPQHRWVGGPSLQLSTFRGWPSGWILSLLGE